MKIPRLTLRAAALVLGVVCGSPLLHAQGVTTAAINGTVSSAKNQPLDGAQITVTNRNTGSRSQATTGANGRYYVQALEVGGPYTVSVRRIGHEPRDSSGIFLSLGQNARIDFVMAERATQLAGVVVTSGSANALMSSAHKGVSTTVTDSAIARLPTQNRNFTDFVTLTPQVSTRGPGNSGAGQNNRFNAIQIDGSVGNDMFGLSSTLQPGGLAGAKQVSLEAIKEYQVLLSPYDVRQGYFSGFLLNAVTKSGSNEMHGTGTYAFRNEQLERNLDFIRASPFKVAQQGFWIGGPVMKDRIFFSIAPEFQQQSAPQSGPYIGQPTSLTIKPPVNQPGVDSVVNTLKTQYGFADPGNSGAVTNKNPLTNFFGRLDFVNLPLNSRLVTRYNYAGADQDQGLTRSATILSLSNAGYTFKSKTNSGLAQLFSTFSGGGSNEALVGLTTIRDVRATPINAPFVNVLQVRGLSGDGTVRAGTENSSQGNELDQDILELSDSYTHPWNSHRITIGTKNEFYKVRNLFSQNSLGNFTFRNMDSLIANKPRSATLGVNIDQLNGNVTDGAARFKAHTLGAYISDDWQATNNLAVTVGLRLDVPGLASSPGFNPRIDSALKIQTNVVPKSSKQWQPRIGFNWDVTGDQINQLRGGTGYFMAQPAYVWLSNLFGNSGVNGFGNLTCSSATNVPGMPNAGQPIATNCVGQTGRPAVTVNTVDPNLHFPEVWRSTLGYDRKLPWNVVGTIEGMYTRSVYDFYYQNLGIVKDSIGHDSHGRALYGDITTAGGSLQSARPCADGVNSSIPGGTVAAGTQCAAPITALGDVIHLQNADTKGYSYNVTTTLLKRFSDSFEGSASYIYGHAYDIYDLTSSVAFSNWSFGRSYSGRQDAQDLSYSKWDSPHRFVLSGTYSLPSKTDISATFFADAGTPFEYNYNQDMNGDASTANDLIYVPTNTRDTLQIRFAQNGPLTPTMQADSLENFIKGHECLNSQRGTIMKRNSCRTPWTKIMNLSARQSLPTLNGHNLILQADVFNFLNLINKHWGGQDLGSTNSPLILSRTGNWVQPTTGQPLNLRSGAQPVFTYQNPSQFSTRNFTSNYALQLQLKYTF
jgi:hypothetical protein